MRHPVRVATALALLAILALAAARPGAAGDLDREALAAMVEPPFELGERLSEDGVHAIVDRTGERAGYVFETRPLAPIPGFSGAPVNVLVTIDTAGTFLDARLLSHNEPVFVSGLGEAPFRAFVRQYRGRSVFDSIVVGPPGASARNGDASGHVHLDGVSKATASVRIAHESILAASLAVVRERISGGGGPGPRPKADPVEDLDWNDLVAEGLAGNRTITNAEVQAAFAGTRFADDDPAATADPDGVFLDVWVVDVGPASIARAVLSEETRADLDTLLSVADHDEPILLLANGRGGFVSDAFVRNTSPDRVFARQDGLPVALRDADLPVTLAPGVPAFEHRMIVRTDRRLGFDPTRDWDLLVRAVREHGMFMPQIGTRDFVSTHRTDARFFDRPAGGAPRPLWLESIHARAADLAVLSVFVVGLALVLGRAMGRLAGLAAYTPARLAVLAFVVVFVGWWGQGQLSVVTVIGTLRAAVEGTGFAFLLYDPFSLLIWGAVIGSFFLWGRGFFCGWLCPYGALQEFSHHAGRRLGLREVTVPEAWDRRLKRLKYAVLALLVVTGVVAPALNDLLVEVEPFKTAITVGFDREWPFVLYALGWLALGLFVFKAFCRYVCPLGAALAIGGLLRRRDWIPRRAECGSPCQLCRVRCRYGAIERTGKIRYDECFQCLDCVTIHDDPKTCVPLVIAARREGR